MHHSCKMQTGYQESSNGNTIGQQTELDFGQNNNNNKTLHYSHMDYITLNFKAKLAV